MNSTNHLINKLGITQVSSSIIYPKLQHLSFSKMSYINQQANANTKIAKIKSNYYLNTDNNNINNKIKLIQQCSKITKKNLAKSGIGNGKIGIKKGERTLKIASVNVTNMRRRNESIESILQFANINNIDITCIQETHSEKITAEKYENRTIFYGGCKTIRNETSNTTAHSAGVAILKKIYSSIA